MRIIERGCQYCNPRLVENSHASGPDHHSRCWDDTSAWTVVDAEGNRVDGIIEVTEGGSALREFGNPADYPAWGITGHTDGIGACGCGFDLPRAGVPRLLLEDHGYRVMEVGRHG